MFELHSAGMLETEHLATLRIDARHDMTDSPILPGRVHRLKNQQQRVLICRVMAPLQRTQLFDVLVQNVAIVFFGFVKRLHQSRPVLEPNSFTLVYKESLAINIHRQSRVWSFVRACATDGESLLPYFCRNVWRSWRALPVFPFIVSTVARPTTAGAWLGCCCKANWNSSAANSERPLFRYASPNSW